MTYSISILRRAQKELAHLPKEAYEQVRDAIRTLAYNQRPPGCRKLSARAGWRIKIGDYRIIYEIDDKSRIIEVLHIGHRRNVYR
jgi:mRNA interferase RelE/StbE